MSPDAPRKSWAWSCAGCPIGRGGPMARLGSTCGSVRRAWLSAAYLAGSGCGKEFYQMEQGLVICPSGKKFPFWQVSRTAAQPGREDVGASTGVTLGPKRPALGGTGSGSSGHPWGRGVL